MLYIYIYMPNIYPCTCLSSQTRYCTTAAPSRMWHFFSPSISTGFQEYMGRNKKIIHRIQYYNRYSDMCYIHLHRNLHAQKMTTHMMIWDIELQNPYEYILVSKMQWSLPRVFTERCGKLYSKTPTIKSRSIMRSHF